MVPCKSVILTEGLPWVNNMKSIKSNQSINCTYEVLHVTAFKAKMRYLSRLDPSFPDGLCKKIQNDIGNEYHGYVNISKYEPA